MKKGVIIVLIAIILVLIAAIALYFLFFNKDICETNTCFSQAITECKKVSYILEDESVIKFYNVLGKKNNQCEVNVEVLQMKKGDIRLENLEGLDMNCFIPENTFVMPETDIKNCHGLLREAMQEEVIQRMHSQIIENLGQINNSINNII